MNFEIKSTNISLKIKIKLTTSLSRLSGTLRVELHNANAEEWEYITGASLTAKVSLAV